jgi:hypothetical protein
MKFLASSPARPPLQRTAKVGALALAFALGSVSQLLAQVGNNNPSGHSGIPARIGCRQRLNKNEKTN